MQQHLRLRPVVAAARSQEKHKFQLLPPDEPASIKAVVGRTTSIWILVHLFVRIWPVVASPLPAPVLPSIAEHLQGVSRCILPVRIVAAVVGALIAITSTLTVHAAAWMIQKSSRDVPFATHIAMALDDASMAFDDDSLHSILVCPVGEEVAYRWMFQRILQRLVGVSDASTRTVRRAVFFVVSLAFALAHVDRPIDIGSPIDILMSFMATGAMSFFCLCPIFARYGLVAAIASHACWNMLSVCACKIEVFMRLYSMARALRLSAD